MLDIIRNLDKEKIIMKAKPLITIATCMATDIVAGFGTGKMQTGTTDKSIPNKRSFINYNTNSPLVNTKTPINEPETKPETKNDASKNSNATVTSNCLIKGSKSKIYHIPGGAFYERTNPAQCFASEDDAQRAGYTKSSR